MVEWGTWGFVQGNGLGTASGTSVAGINVVQVTGLTPGTAYEYYVHEQCDSLNSTQAGPSGFMTDSLQAMIPDTVFLFVDSVAGFPYHSVFLSLRARSFNDIVSAQGTLTWDPNVALFVGVTILGLPSMTTGNFGTSQASAGKLSFSWNDPTLIGVTLADSAPLFTLEFEPYGPAGGHTDLDSTNVPVSWEVVNANLDIVFDSLVPGYFYVLDSLTHVEGEEIVEQRIAYPNPVSLAGGGLRLRLPEGAEVEGMAWINALGQTLAGEDNWVQSGGEVACHVPTGAVPGIWTLRVLTAAGPLDYRIVVDRH